MVTKTVKPRRPRATDETRLACSQPASEDFGKVSAATGASKQLVVEMAAMLIASQPDTVLRKLRRRAADRLSKRQAVLTELYNRAKDDQNGG